MAKKADKTESRLPPLLRTSWYNLNKAFRRKICHLDITPDQFTILRWIVESKGKEIIQRDLVTLMSSDANTITSIVKRMVNSGLLTRQVSETDKRVYKLKITTKGKKKYDLALPLSKEIQHCVVSKLSEKQQKDLCKYLNIISDATSDLLT